MTANKNIQEKTVSIRLILVSLSVAIACLFASALFIRGAVAFFLTLDIPLDNYGQSVLSNMNILATMLSIVAVGFVVWLISKSKDKSISLSSVLFTIFLSAAFAELIVKLCSIAIVIDTYVRVALYLLPLYVLCFSVVYYISCRYAKTALVKQSRMQKIIALAVSVLAYVLVRWFNYQI